MKTATKTNKDWANSVIYWLSRPYVLLLTIAFIFTPIPHIASALESGSDFLNIEIGAKPGAMGSAYTAMSNDVNSIYYSISQHKRYFRQSSGPLPGKPSLLEDSATPIGFYFSNISQHLTPSPRLMSFLVFHPFKIYECI